MAQKRLHQNWNRVATNKLVVKLWAARSNNMNETARPSARATRATERVWPCTNAEPELHSGLTEKINKITERENREIDTVENTFQ